MDPGAERFIAHARSMLGTRWRHRGRKPWGVDCIGLIVLASCAAGLDVEDPHRYGNEPWDDRLRKWMVTHFGAPVIGARAGDVAVIRWHWEEPCHAGIVADHPAGGLSLIHAHSLHGVIEQALSGPVLQRVVEYYRPWRG